MALCWNEAEATEAIKEAKAHCGAAVREAEACHATLIREVEDDCTTTVVEAEAHCTTDIRKAESHCMEKACSIHQLHAEDTQCLEKEAIEEEGRDHLSFLAAHGAAPQACSWGPHGSPSTTHGEHTTGHPSKPPRCAPLRERPTTIVSPATTPVALEPPLGIK